VNKNEQVFEFHYSNIILTWCEAYSIIGIMREFFTFNTMRSTTFQQFDFHFLRCRTSIQRFVTSFLYFFLSFYLDVRIDFSFLSRVVLKNRFVRKNSGKRGVIVSNLNLHHPVSDFYCEMRLRDREVQEMTILKRCMVEIMKTKLKTGKS
jgi:hypothetical protein